MSTSEYYKICNENLRKKPNSQIKCMFAGGGGGGGGGGWGGGGGGGGGIHKYLDTKNY